MQITKQIQNGALAIIFMAALLLPLTGLRQIAIAVADTCTWIGGTDSNFNTAANWSCSTDGTSVPENGDVIEFDMTAATTIPSETILNNDIVGLDVAGINLTGGNGNGYGFTVQGNAITLTGDVTGDQTDGNLYLEIDIDFGSNVEYSVPESAVVFGNNVNPHTLDLSTFDFTVSSPAAVCKYVKVYSALSGGGSIISNSGAADILLRNPTGGNPAFTGDVTINGAGLTVYRDTLLGFNTTVTMNNSSILSLISTSDQNFDFDVVMNSDAEGALRAGFNGHAFCSGGLTEPSEVTIGDLTLLQDTEYYGENNLVVEGTFTSNDFELTTKQGSIGSITTSEGTVETEASTVEIDKGDDSSASVNVVNKQTVVLNGSRGIISVNYGGILKGTGSAETVLVYTGGTIAPGLSPGCLSTGNLTINGSYQFEINGNTVCTEYDQIDVTGTVDVTGGTLDLARATSFVPALNDEFILINNDGSDAVVGEFADWAEGDKVIVDGVTYEITYEGGDGNDVVVTVVAIDSAVAEAAGTPDTGLQSILANPFVGLSAVIVSAGTLFVLRRKQLI